MKDATPRGPHDPAPAHSCMDGAVLCLKTLPKTSVDPCLPLPIKMTVGHRDLGNGEPGYVVQVETLTLSQALDHKRLKLTVDSQGVVKTVHGASPKTLFGFNPKLLLGNPIRAFLDVFKGPQEPHKALSVLSECTDRSPGTSWRVGVIGPVKVDPEQALSGRLEQIKTGGEVTPGVMTIKRKLQGPTAEGGVAGGPGKVASRWVWAGDLATGPNSSGGAGVESGSSSSILYELELWRSDLLVSIIDLDSRGELKDYLSPHPPL